MKLKKRVMAKLEKCYCVAPLIYKGKVHILAAAEKCNPCYMFDLDGNYEETVWEEPGGVMSMVQVPESDGVFLATHRFYSPNDSKEAEIVLVSADASGKWNRHTIVKLPHVHRFDILTRNGVHYLIACTLKSGHRHKDDWSSPGKVYAAVLPNVLNSSSQLEFSVIKFNMPKNHGYYKMNQEGTECCIISCEKGIYLFTPPDAVEAEWEIKLLLDEPGSDAVLIDLDEDGEKELVVISPFHGENILFYKKRNQIYEKVFSYSHADFAHAIYGGEFDGKPSVIIGHRDGARSLLLFTYDKESNDYQVDILDENCGAANVLKYRYNEKEVLVSANREINEVAMYLCEK